jgi:hypothetical protein
MAGGRSKDLVLAGRQRALALPDCGSRQVVSTAEPPDDGTNRLRQLACRCVFEQRMTKVLRNEGQRRKAGRLGYQADRGRAGRRRALPAVPHRLSDLLRAVCCPREQQCADTRHIRNDTRDVSRRMARRQATRFAGEDGKEGVDGSSPSEGFTKAPQNAAFSIRQSGASSGFGVHGSAVEKPAFGPSRSFRRAPSCGDSVFRLEAGLIGVDLRAPGDAKSRKPEGPQDLTA